MEIEKERKVGISACLIGEDCRYDGKNSLIKEIIEAIPSEKLVPVCPEVLGGLPVPRDYAEIQNGSGEDVIEGRAKVITYKGADITENYLKGAYRCLEIFKKEGVKFAIFKSKSPSCGVGQIYDGTFSKRLKEGNGVTTALLIKNGIKVIREEDFLKNKK
ncbi:MAG: DUF523 domain-containing protein [Candidatus Omnitrophota bacterium]|nr:MAG: DUF523 domain-containing protein [Candidatus Omnitrophota bacterium]